MPASTYYSSWLSQPESSCLTLIVSCLYNNSVKRTLLFPLHWWGNRYSSKRLCTMFKVQQIIWDNVRSLNQAMNTMFFPSIHDEVIFNTESNHIPGFCLYWLLCKHFVLELHAELLFTSSKTGSRDWKIQCYWRVPITSSIWSSFNRGIGKLINFFTSPSRLDLRATRQSYYRYPERKRQKNQVQLMGYTKRIDRTP